MRTAEEWANDLANIFKLDDIGEDMIAGAVREIQKEAFVAGALCGRAPYLGLVSYMHALASTLDGAPKCDCPDCERYRAAVAEVNDGRD